MSYMNQDSIFFDYEGDNWFTRNKDKITKKRSVSSEDQVLKMLGEYGIKPRRILEVGCSNGWRLNNLQKKYKAECVGVEPSAEAVRDGKKRYPKLKLQRALASKMPIEGSFDLVIVSFVFHWIARDGLLKSVSEIDRLVKNEGFLIISDFSPDVPTRVLYHHLPEKNVYTYKLDYPKIFTSTAIYTPVGRFTFSQDYDKLDAKVDSSGRGACTLLRKSLKSFSAGV